MAAVIVTAILKFTFLVIMIQCKMLCPKNVILYLASAVSSLYSIVCSNFETRYWDLEKYKRFYTKVANFWLL